MFFVWCCYKLILTVTMKKVSIVVPIYNVEEYVAQCIESLIGQSFSNIEILCIDDCSPDRSIDIAMSYASHDNRMKIIRHDHNLGLGGARNTGVRHSTGDYLCFVDSDDYVDSRFVELLYKAIDQQRADIAVCGLWKDEGGQIGPFYRQFSDETLAIDESKTNAIEVAIQFNQGCANKMYRREIIVDNKIVQPEHRYYEDVIFWFKAVYYSDVISTVADRLYYYRQRPGSIMKRLTKKHIEDRLEFIKQIDRFTKKTILRSSKIDSEKVKNDSLLYILDHLHFGGVLISQMGDGEKGDIEKYYSDLISEFSLENNWPALDTIYRIYAERMECFCEKRALDTTIVEGKQELESAAEQIVIAERDKAKRGKLAAVSLAVNVVMLWYVVASVW